MLGKHDMSARTRNIGWDWESYSEAFLAKTITFLIYFLVIIIINS